MARILIVDDEANMRRILAAILQEAGHDVTAAATVADARGALASASLDLVITDQKLPDGDGLTVIRVCAETDATLPVIMLTAYATVELAVEAMRQGAFDFIPKPFLPEPVTAAVRRALEHTVLLRENERLRGQVRRLGPAADLIGESEGMRRAKDLIARVAPTNATVLITGETGTGKELVARAIHAASPRSAGPFVAVNCAAFTESLLESELFGHEKGAFTGAERAREGLFEAADQGTLLLDEAGEMSLALQAKLLRVLMNGEVVRVGSRVVRRVDVRILAATHRDLQQRVREGLFREDLYYRLAVVPLPIPPLRERPEDVPLLVEHFLQAVAVDLKMPRRTIAPAAVDRLRHYPFPGNVRELRNLVERACILSRGDAIGPHDLPVLDDGPAASGREDGLEAFVAALPASIDLRETLDEVERHVLERFLEDAGGVQAEAARKLGLSRSDIGYKIRKLGL